MLNVLWCLLLGYALGSINPSYIIARLRGFDIRKRGSGNAGASNALIVMGKAVGIFSAVFDIAKAYFAVYIARRLFPELAVAGALSGSACIIGHIFPIMMKFRGGKGLACLGGVVLSFDYRVFLVMLTLELIIVLAVDYICVVPITASIAYPFVHGMMVSWLGGIIFIIPGCLILYKHIENIRRIRNGTEAHLSFLWKRNEEIERLKQNRGDKD